MPHRKPVRHAFAAWLALASFSAFAQLAADQPGWKELDVPPAPVFDVARLVGIDGPADSALKFGVDPNTISIAPEGVVRYVVVATSRSGATNAMYEGVRCATGEFRVYARHNPSGGWANTTATDWKSLYATAPSRHTLAIARAGVCKGNAPNTSVEQIVRDLKASPDRRFE
jgi:CNP1-like family